MCLYCLTYTISHTSSIDIDRRAIDGNCYLGDLVHGSSVYIDNDIKNDINIYRGMCVK